MSENRKLMGARWLPIVDLGLAALAGALWYVRLEVGWFPLVLIGAAWLLRLIVYRYPTRATPFDLPLVLFLLTAYIGASIGYNQGSEWIHPLTPLTWAWAKYYFILAALGIYYAIANLRSVEQVWWLVGFYALFGSIVAIYFVVTNDWSQSVKFTFLSEIGTRIAAFLPNLPGHRLAPNVAGGIIAMTMPFGVPLFQDAWAQKRRRVCWLWLAVAVVALFGLLMSGSRGAWIALAAVALVWFLARRIPVSGRGGARRASLALAVAVQIIAIGLIGVSLMQLGIISGDLMVQLPGSSALFSRVELLQGSLALAQDYVFTGGGLGAFPMLFSTYYLLVPVFYIIYSHNLFLDILIEQGLVGLLSYAWLLIALGVLVLGNLARLATQQASGSPATQARVRTIFEALLASVGVAIMHGLVDDIPYGSRALMLMFVPFGIAAALQGCLPMRAWRVPTPVIGGSIALLALLAMWQRDTLLGAWFANWGALKQAQVELRSYHFPERVPESVRTSANLTDAISNFERALDYDPNQRTANQRLAAIALARGNYDAAGSYLDGAYARDTMNPVTGRLFANLYWAMGMKDEACQIAERAKEMGMEGPWRFPLNLCGAR